ncbi:MAG: carbamoyltransferase HypF [Cyanobium sp.]
MVVRLPGLLRADDAVQRPSLTTGSPGSPFGVDPPASVSQGEGEPVAVRLLCRGVVQGVGFRPAVCRLASAAGLDGVLTNIVGAVRLDLAGPRAVLEAFVTTFPAALRPPIRLEELKVEWLCRPWPSGLAIGAGVQIRAGHRQPLEEGWFAPSLSADLAPCRDCLAELCDPRSRRFRYPFLSCSRCGPRYSIATAEPWCRDHTTLVAFPPCADCRREFDDPADRRFHAETIACPACGPRLQLWLAEPAATAFAPCPSQDPLERSLALLKGGGILALQGVGGFQLLVDATQPEAVQRLRRRKARPAKPFALLVSELSQLRDLVWVDAQERQWLLHPSAPIVLLRRQPMASRVPVGVAPGSDSLGVLLPASPLHQLLAEAMGGPLVCTSGNRSGEPLCLEPREARVRLFGIADAVLEHDRPIARRLDDSLLQVSSGRRSLLRRARGFCPEPLALPPALAAAGSEAGADVLALGSDLKAAPALAQGDRCWLAPHLGDLAGPGCLDRLRMGLAEELRRPRSGALHLAFDGHPGYLSRHQAISLPLPLRPVAHHLAHGLAVVAEHGLQAPLLLLALDGLGYGDPGEETVARPLLRGGEVLLVDRDPSGAWRSRSVAHLLPFPLPGGERAMREPRRAALGLLHRAGALDHPGAWRLERAFHPLDRSLLLQALQTGCQAPLCSSAGRLFDAAASLLGLVQVQHHEGEGGQKLQAAALRAPSSTTRRVAHASASIGLCLSPQAEGRPSLLDWRPLLQGLLARSRPGGDRHDAAAWFHQSLAAGLSFSLAELVGRLRLPRPAVRIALCGGCFQNRLLLECTAEALRGQGLEPFWSEAVPCNDGGLAVGQLWAVRRGLTSGGDGGGGGL